MTLIPERDKKIFNFSLSVPFLCAAAVWIVCFFGFLFGRLALTEDALSYLDQVEHLTGGFLKGEFPVWNESYFFGMPNDFFYCG